MVTGISLFPMTIYHNENDKRIVFYDLLIFVVPVIHIIHIVICHFIIIRHHIKAPGYTIPAASFVRLVCESVVSISVVIKTSSISVTASAVSVTTSAKLIHPVTPSGRKTIIVYRKEKVSGNARSHGVSSWKLSAGETTSRSAAGETARYAALNHLLHTI